MTPHDMCPVLGGVQCTEDVQLTGEYGEGH